MVSTHYLISVSSSPFINPLVTVLRAPITIGIDVTFIFHSFFSYQARSRYLSFFSLSSNFIQWSAGTAKSTILQILFFLFWLNIIMSSRLDEIKWSVCMSKPHRREACASHFPEQILGCAYTIYSYGRISISYTIPCGSLCVPSRILSYTLLC